MKRMICAVLLCLFLAGCTGQTQQERTIFAMDTVMQLRLWGSTAAQADSALDAMEALIAQLEQDWSALNEDSLIGRLNRGQRIGLSQEQQRLLDKVQELSARTGGAFDPQLYSVCALWGFYDDQYQVPTQEQIDRALADKKWDLGGVLKGYAGQRCAELLQEKGIDRAILNLGGNIQTFGEKPDGSPWQIGIQNPAGGENAGIVSLYGTAAVVTSGDYQRYFEKDGVRYHHIFDPKTGRPADNGLSSVTVICSDGMMADALSTALFVMGLEQAAEFWRQSTDFEAVFILSDGRIYATEGAALTQCEFEVISRGE